MLIFFSSFTVWMTTAVLIFDIYIYDIIKLCLARKEMQHKFLEMKRDDAWQTCDISHFPHFFSLLLKQMQCSDLLEYEN